MEKEIMSTATPSADEAAAVMDILSVFAEKQFTYKQAEKVLPFVQKALDEFAYSHVVKTVNRKNQ